MQPKVTPTIPPGAGLDALSATIRDAIFIANRGLGHSSEAIDRLHDPSVDGGLMFFTAMALAAARKARKK